MLRRLIHATAGGPLQPECERPMRATTKRRFIRTSIAESRAANKKAFGGDLLSYPFREPQTTDEVHIGPSPG